MKAMRKRHIFNPKWITTFCIIALCYTNYYYNKWTSRKTINRIDNLLFWCQ